MLSNALDTAAKLKADASAAVAQGTKDAQKAVAMAKSAAMQAKVLKS